MLLNRLEYWLMNSAARSAVQRHFEARRLLRLGGKMDGGLALEVGCGRGTGLELILDRFGASAAHGFDLDPRMIDIARTRLANRTGDVRLWVGDAADIEAESGTYDAVFDFGVIHHIPDWRAAINEVARVLKPRGKFCGEEIAAGLLENRIVRRMFRHPRENRFSTAEFRSALERAGFDVRAWKSWRNWALWFVAIESDA